MRNLVGLLVVVATLALATEARADGFFSLDHVFLDARGHVFTDGDVRSALGTPVGVDAEIQLDLAHHVDFWAQLGFLYGLSSEVSNWHVPAMIGALYNISDGGSSPFISAGFGATITKVESVDTEFNSSFEIGGGYEMSSLRIKVALFFFDTGELGDSASLMASLGYALK